jgi:hypothetical protein
VTQLYVNAKRLALVGVSLAGHPSQTHEITKNISLPSHRLLSLSSYIYLNNPPQFLEFSLQATAEEVSLPFLYSYFASDTGDYIFKYATCSC